MQLLQHYEGGQLAPDPVDSVPPFSATITPAPSPSPSVQAKTTARSSLACQASARGQSASPSGTPCSIPGPPPNTDAGNLNRVNPRRRAAPVAMAVPEPLALAVDLGEMAVPVNEGSVRRLCQEWSRSPCFVWAGRSLFDF